MLDKTLSMVGEVRTQVEIHGEVQAADVWFLPRAGCAAERGRLGLLGRMAETACLLEPFHATPGGDAVLDCVSKLLTLRHNLVRDARKGDRAPVVPRLWILSSGRPESVLAGLGCAPLAGWPPGVWQAPSLFSTYLVALRDLPETRDTLPLRLMGSGVSLRRAVSELTALPAGAWEPRTFLPMLLAFRPHVPQDSGDRNEDDMGYAAELEAIYAEYYADWERRVEERGLEKGLEQGLEKGLEQGLEKGLEQGLEQGLRNALVSFYQARFGALPAALRAVIEATEDAPTLQRWTALFGSATADEIATVLLDGDAAGRP